MEKISVNVEKIITTYCAGGEQFKIVKFDNEKYGAINTKYIKDGKVTKELNGFDMCLGHTFNECIERVDKEIKIKEFMKQGFDEIASVMLSHGESKEKALECSRKMKEFYAQA